MHLKYGVLLGCIEVFQVVVKCSRGGEGEGERQATVMRRYTKM